MNGEVVDGSDSASEWNLVYHNFQFLDEVLPLCGINVYNIGSKITVGKVDKKVKAAFLILGTFVTYGIVRC